MKTITALLLLLPILASAQPGAATRYLMTEPASLMDIGLIRLGKELEEMAHRFRKWYETDTRTEGVSVTTAAEYFSEHDKIRVHISVSVKSLKNAESGCRELIEPLKGHVARLENSAFRHDGYTNPNRPEDLARHVLDRTDLFCHVFIPGTRRGEVTVKYSFSDDQIAIYTD